MIQERRGKLVASTRQVASWQAVVSLLLVLAAVIAAARATVPRGVSRDFATLDAGAACLREGCSPYDIHALDRMVTERGHGPLDRWPQQLPIYPPTTLALFVPLTYLGVHAASVCVWLLAVGAMLGAGYVCFVRGPLLAKVPLLLRTLLIVLPLSLGEARQPLLLGNPVALAVPLLLFCCFDTQHARRDLRAALFAVACLLKPQIGLPFVLPLLLKQTDGWRMVLRSAVTAAVFSAAVVAWCATHPALAHWPGDLHREVLLGASAGNSMDPGDRTLGADHLLNLQYLFGYWSSRPAVRDGLTFAAVAVLVTGLIAGTLRLRAVSEATALPLVVAATAAVTLLPVYHRSYDSTLLLLTLPWALVAWHQQRHRLAAAWTVVVYGIEMLQQRLHRFALHHGADAALVPRSLANFLQLRYDAVVVVGLAVLLIAVLWKGARQRPNPQPYAAC